jgi:hypothetical protein
MMIVGRSVLLSLIAVQVFRPYTVLRAWITRSHVQHRTKNLDQAVKLVQSASECPHMLEVSSVPLTVDLHLCKCKIVLSITQPTYRGFSFAKKLLVADDKYMVKTSYARKGCIG